MLQIRFCVFKKNAVKVWNVLGNALEKFWIWAHKIKMVWAIRLQFGSLIVLYYHGIVNLDLAFIAFWNQTLHIQWRGGGGGGWEIWVLFGTFIHLACTFSPLLENGGFSMAGYLDTVEKPPNMLSNVSWGKVHSDAIPRVSLDATLMYGLRPGCRNMDLLVPVGTSTHLNWIQCGFK
jgi:hypothetical protein